MFRIEPANSGDRRDIDRLIAAYHSSEGLNPNPERIAWAVDQHLRNLFPGVLLVARQDSGVVGVALAVYTPSAELGSILVVNDFFVEPHARRKGVGRALANGLVKEAVKMNVDRVDLEVLTSNTIAVAFWLSLGFRTEGRTIYGKATK